MIDMSKKGKLFSALGGLAVGAGLGVLFAPKKGSETREELMLKIKELKEEAKKLNKEDVYNYFETTVETIKKELDELDKEKILRKAEAKSKELEKKAEELVKYAKKKGNDELDKIADSLRLKVIEVSKNIVEKLEEK
ncbi:hypothetical protein EOM09_07620 [bacterium]|nr:hypothetical protein [bacterium]